MGSSFFPLFIQLPILWLSHLIANLFSDLIIAGGSLIDLADWCCLLGSFLHNLTVSLLHFWDNQACPIWSLGPTIMERMKGTCGGHAWMSSFWRTAHCKRILVEAFGQEPSEWHKKFLMQSWLVDCESTLTHLTCQGTNFHIKLLQQADQLFQNRDTHLKHVELWNPTRSHHAKTLLCSFLLTCSLLAFHAFVICREIFLCLLGFLFVTDIQLLTVVVIFIRKNNDVKMKLVLHWSHSCWSDANAQKMHLGVSHLSMIFKKLCDQWQLLSRKVWLLKQSIFHPVWSTPLQSTWNSLFFQIQVSHRPKWIGVFFGIVCWVEECGHDGCVEKLQCSLKTLQSRLIPSPNDESTSLPTPNLQICESVVVSVPYVRTT